MTTTNAQTTVDQPQPDALGLQPKHGASEGSGVIRPIIMFPFGFPKVSDHLERLYDELVGTKLNDTSRYATPITIINQQTRLRNVGKPAFDKAVKMVSKYCGTPHYTWSVDTCQMWLTGFGGRLPGSDHRFV